MSTAEATPARFYGRKRHTAAGRLLAATTPSRATAQDWTPSSTSRYSDLQTPRTPAATSHVSRTPRPSYTPQGQLRDPDQGTGMGASLHYKPGERLQDRSDIFSGGGSGSDAESEQEPEFTLPLGGSSRFNSRNGGFALNSAESTESEWQRLLQNQQAMLLKVIQQQDDMKEQYSEIGKRLDTLEGTVEGLVTQCEQGRNDVEDQNKKLPRELKVRQCVRVGN